MDTRAAQLESSARVLTVGSLFAGIGGLDLGLERAGMRVIWQAETDPFCAGVLRRHWPGVVNHGDVRSIRSGSAQRPDVVAAGFPCQDISIAGRGAGIRGERSGLWSEVERIAGELGPRWIVLENVAALLGRGMGEVLGDLAALGYDAEWHCVPAAAVGAPHWRDRVFIVGRTSYADGVERGGVGAASWNGSESGGGRSFADAEGVGIQGNGAAWQQITLAPILARLLGRDNAGDYWRERQAVAAIRRMDDGIPAGVDRRRLKALGNAVVPQVAELIGRAIMEAEAGRC